MSSVPAIVMGAVEPLMGALVMVVGMPNFAASLTFAMDWVQNFKGLIIAQELMENIGRRISSSLFPATRLASSNASCNP